MTGRRKTWAAISLVTVVGLYWFQPWKLWVDERVDEALPAVAAPSSLSSSSSSSSSASSAPGARLVDRPAPAPAVSPTVSPTASPTAVPRPTLLSRGTFISHEHRTRGTVSVIRLADGHRVLTLSDLDTSNGPDVEVWLTDAPVVAGEKGWYLADDGAHRSLGDLKGNQGNQVYRIPDDVELSRFTSVSLWCARFDVSFGAAELSPA